MGEKIGIYINGNGLSEGLYIGRAYKIISKEKFNRYNNCTSVCWLSIFIGLSS